LLGSIAILPVLDSLDALILLQRILIVLFVDNSYKVCVEILASLGPCHNGVKIFEGANLRGWGDVAHSTTAEPRALLPYTSLRFMLIFTVWSTAPPRR
jgi:hypothetical protein